MPGRWLKKVGKLADKAIDKVSDEVKDRVSDVDMGNTMSTLIEKGGDCGRISRETIQICDDTATKRDQLIAFGTTIQSTLQSMGEGSENASILETIQDLTAGDKVNAAMELAQGLDVAALACVDKSIEMVDLMESGMDSLPEYLQSAIEGYAGKEEDNGDDDGAANDDTVDIVKDISRDFDDIKTCIDSIDKLNLSNALTVGLQAFAQIAEKSKLSQTLFQQVRSFASDVQEISDAFQDMNPMAVAAKSKDMLRCIRLSEAMRLIAEGAGKLIKLIIELFRATADRISVLWAALAHAKDCMMDCLTHVNGAKELCFEARDKSMGLVTKSISIKDQLEQVGEINMQSMTAIRSLSQDGEMQEAIDIANNMDELVLDCSDKVFSMVNRVNEGFSNLPTILTEDIDVAAEGCGRPEEPANVERDISDLEECRTLIEEASIVSAGKAGVRGFGGVSEKATVCKDMLELVEEFATACSTVIEAFMSSWDLNSAAKKISDMCHLVNLGELMKQFADQIKRLLVAIVNLIKASMAKFSNGLPESLSSVKDNVGESLDVAREQLESKVDDMKDQMKDKLQFWK